MKFRILSALIFCFALGCGGVEEPEDLADTGEDNNELACPGVFPSGEGPGCCSEEDQLTPDSGRATCEEGEWTCSTGEVCACNGELAGFECLDSCDWEISQPAGCIFSDHFECFDGTLVPSDTCE